MKFSFFTLTLFITGFGFSQNWLPFNDTLIYYHQQEDQPQEILTLRLDSLAMFLGEPGKPFSNNYIPCYDCTGSFIHYYYHDKGGVLGKTYSISNDTFYFGYNRFLYLNMELDDTSFFKTDLSQKIALYDVADTIIFGSADSVEYYRISDGKELWLSKNHGLLRIPNMLSDSIYHFNLIGIEDFGGKNYDWHNEIFDFDNGDQFYFRGYISSYDLGENFVQEVYYTMTIFLVEEYQKKKFYNVSYDIISLDENSPLATDVLTNNHIFPYDYHLESERLSNPFYLPGEVLRGPYENDITNDFYHANLLSSKKSFHHFDSIPQLRIGYMNFPEYSTTGDIDNYYQFCHLNLTNVDTGIIGMADSSISFPSSHVILLTYEMGLGRTHFKRNQLDYVVESDLLAYIKGDDTLGTYDLGMHNAEGELIHLFPNPATNFIQFNPNANHVKIYNLSGIMVLEKAFPNGELNIEQLPKGMYIIELISPTGKMVHDKFEKL